MYRNQQIWIEVDWNAHIFLSFCRMIRKGSTCSRTWLCSIRLAHTHTTEKKKTQAPNTHNGSAFISFGRDCRQNRRADRRHSGRIIHSPFFFDAFIISTIFNRWLFGSGRIPQMDSRDSQQIYRKSLIVKRRLVWKSALVHAESAHFNKLVFVYFHLVVSLCSFQKEKKEKQTGILITLPQFQSFRSWWLQFWLKSVTTTCYQLFYDV